MVNKLNDKEIISLSEQVAQEVKEVNLPTQEVAPAEENPVDVEEPKNDPIVVQEQAPSSVSKVQSTNLISQL